MSGKRITTADNQRRQRYLRTRGQQLGNLHQRMRYVMELAGRERENMSPALLHALWDLDLEVSYHAPAEPPFGQRTVARGA